ncbi:uncharacterized protein ACMZJ9_009972 [Mantella aurantiaca]
MTIRRILLLLSLQQIYEAWDVFAPSPQRALVTNEKILNCTFSVDKQPLDLSFLAVLWRFQEKELLRYDNKRFSTQDPRMSLNVESLRDGYVSLHISNVTISDGGLYKCTVIYSPESKEKDILFEVLARPVLSILSTKVQRNTESILTCKATGFFPPDIGITWYRKDEVLRNEYMGKPKTYKDGTYEVDSTVTITPTEDDQNQNFSCRVQHDSLEKPLQRDFQLIYEVAALESSHSRDTEVDKEAICMGTSTVMDIEGPTKLIAEEETTLFCRATKFPENTSVTWSGKRGGQYFDIPESHGGDTEEEERLMDTQYGVISFKSYREGPNYTSSLKFRPSVNKHKDVTFTCTYSCGKEKKEKTFHCRAIYAKPQLLQPVSRSLVISGVLKYLVTLEKFYPRDITIRWTQGVEESQQPRTSTETFTEGPDGTYSVCSEITIPEELLKDPEFRVRVSWEHESLDSLEYKDLSIRDPEYPWTPVMEWTQTPNLFHDTPVTLQCQVSEFFPNTITVTWLRRINNQELCEETDNMVSRTIDSWRAADNTYSCTARLTIIPKLTVHQGAEFICRVDHPSLEEPMESPSGKVSVKAKPQMVEPIEITVEDSSRVHFTLTLQKFYPENIEVDWNYEIGKKQHKMSSSNTSKKYDDLTHDVTSVSSIPMHLFNDPLFNVSVRWNHDSMEEAESRTLTVRDLRPQVGEIIIPGLTEDKQVSLTCDISGCHPDHMTVSWLKKHPGTDLQLNLISLSDDAYQVCNKQKNDKTFSCQSSLTFIPSISRDQGSEFICRVQHPSLESPIERRTGPLGISSLSHNRTAITGDETSVPSLGLWKSFSGGHKLEKPLLPKLTEDEQASRTSNISEQVKDHMNESWFKKEPRTDVHHDTTA